MSRTFEDKPAVREKVPVLIGIAGCSGSGKTFSALRLATGIQRVFGGDVFFIDTEAGRALHYAEKFKFRHLPFTAPFSSSDYLAAIEHCVARGAKTIIVDSMSHEHEGPGGYLEWHDREAEQLAKKYNTSVEAMNISGWAAPARARTRLINTMLGLPVNFVLCFRAKEKLKVIKGKPPVALGWMPLAGDEYVYAMTLKCLLYPGSDGTPIWNPEMPGEKVVAKLPDQFREFFKSSPQLSEDVGEMLAKWASGGATPATAPKIDDLIAAYESCSDEALYTELERDRNAVWKKLTRDQQTTLKALSAKVDERLRKAMEASR